MSLTRRTLIGAGGSFALLAGMIVLEGSAHGQGVTQEQITLLMPDEQDLKGFVRVRPSGEAVDGFKDEPLSDRVRLNKNLGEISSKRTGTVSSIARAFFSNDGLYRLAIDITLCDSRSTAEKELRFFLENVQAAYQNGRFGNTDHMGDESYFFSDETTSLVLRHGRVVIHIEGDFSTLAQQKEVRSGFPPAAVEAVAYMILLRGSRYAKLTGAPARAVSVAINGKPLSAGAALAVGGKVYVPVIEFAEAAGLQSQWNARTGNLTLSHTGRPSITLTAGSTSAKVGTGGTSLKTPVLKEAGQPVMALDDLLPLVQGRIIKRQGDTLRVVV